MQWDFVFGSVCNSGTTGRIRMVSHYDRLRKFQTSISLFQELCKPVGAVLFLTGLCVISSNDLHDLKLSLTAILLQQCSHFVVESCSQLNITDDCNTPESSYWVSRHIGYAVLRWFTCHQITGVRYESISFAVECSVFWRFCHQESIDLGQGIKLQEVVDKAMRHFGKPRSFTLIVTEWYNGWFSCGITVIQRKWNYTNLVGTALHSTVIYYLTVNNYRASNLYLHSAGLSRLSTSSGESKTCDLL